MEAIVLAGGFGTRLAQVVKDVPKPMAPVCGRPFLEYLLDWLTGQGVDRVVLAVGYKKECVMDHFGQEYRGAAVAYSVEDTPLYTGGAAKKALGLCREERVFVANGDSWFPVDLLRMRREAEASGAPVAIAVKRMQHFSRYGNVTIDSEGVITAFNEKRYCEDGCINGGVYDVARHVLDGYPEAFSMENDCFPALVRERGIRAFPDEVSFIDIGIPEDYARAQELFKGLAR